MRETSISEFFFDGATVRVTWSRGAVKGLGEDEYEPTIEIDGHAEYSQVAQVMARIEAETDVGQKARDKAKLAAVREYLVESLQTKRVAGFGEDSEEMLHNKAMLNELQVKMYAPKAK